MGCGVKPASMRPAPCTTFSTRELPITGSEVARRLNVDRSTVGRAVQSAEKDADLVAAENTILKSFEQSAAQQ